MFVVSQADAGGILAKLRIFFATFGLADEIVSDNGPPFGSYKFTRFGELNGIKITKAPAYHPESNGLAERGVQTAKSALKEVFTRSQVRTPRYSKEN